MTGTLPRPRPRHTPLPIKEGLNPSRVRVEVGGVSAWQFLSRVIAGQRHRHPADDDAALARRFSAGEIVLRDGRALSPSTLLAAGDDVFFYRMPAPEAPVPYDLEIVYEDADILVINKPPFMATMPRGSHIVHTATVQLRRRTANDELVPAHRLDRLTSGLLLFTKRRELRGPYQTLFANRRVHKKYSAIAPLIDVATPAHWRSRLCKTPGQLQGTREEGEPNAHTVLHAVQHLTHEPRAHAYGDTPPLGRYLLEPRTGKTHQLRLHMWHAGAPILGDPLYPRVLAEDEEDASRPLLLQACELAFRDPLSGQRRYFSIDAVGLESWL